MTTTTKAAIAERILAIDLGNYKSVACDYHSSSGEVAFASFDTTRIELHKQFGQRRPGVVVIEACALSGWVHDLCSELGLLCRVANTASEAWKRLLYRAVGDSCIRGNRMGSSAYATHCGHHVRNQGIDSSLIVVMAPN